MSAKNRFSISFLILTSALPLLSASGWAASTATDVSPAQPTENTSSGSVIPELKKYDDDTEITDTKLKADAGSLSTVSLRANLSYYGASPSNLGALNQPNPDGIVTATQTAISGSLGARYRLSPNTTISLYAGVSDLYAFHPNQTLNLNSPTVSYDTTFKLLGIQFLSSPSATYVTQATYRNAGESYSLGYYLSGVYNIGRSGFAIGSENSIGYYFFDRDYNGAPHGDGMVRRMNLALAPFVKFNITEKWNVNTMTGFTLYNLRQDPSITELGTRIVTQKLAVGYAVTRDFYVQPYVQFYPKEITLNETTVNLLTSFSVL